MDGSAGGLKTSGNASACVRQTASFKTASAFASSTVAARIMFGLPNDPQPGATNGQARMAGWSGGRGWWFRGSRWGARPSSYHGS